MTLQHRRSRPDARSYRHVKFDASLTSPVPLYRVCLGYGHSGLVREAALKYPGFVAAVVTESGATPFSTQLTSCGSMSKLSVAGPPLQWFMPGTTKKRAKSWALEPIWRFIASYHRNVSLIDTDESLPPWYIISFPPRFLNTERSTLSVNVRLAVECV